MFNHQVIFWSKIETPFSYSNIDKKKGNIIIDEKKGSKWKMETYQLYVMQICPDILAAIILLFMVYLLNHNVIKSRKQTRYFMLAVLLTFTIVILEAATALFKYYPNITSSHVMYGVNALGFILSPIVPVAMTMMMNHKVQNKKYLILPLIPNIVVGISSYFNGALFYISQEGIYERGSFFWIFPMTICYTFLVFVYKNHKNSKELDRVDRSYLYGLYIIVIVGSIVQMIFYYVVLMWCCISISLFLYYVFIREIDLKYDALTNLRNRRCFDNKMKELETKNNVGIMLFDINNLKLVNDTEGHLEGDQHILKAVTLIKACVNNLGIIYRIGGDEFCILFENMDKNRLESLTMQFRNQLNLSKENSGDVLLCIACGYAHYNVGSENSIYDCFSLADEMMYVNKNEIKNTTFG